MRFGGIAQLVEHLPCKQDVIGSNPITSTTGRTLPWAYPKIVSALVAIVQGAISIKDTLVEYRKSDGHLTFEVAPVNCHYRRSFCKTIFQLIWNIIDII